MRQILRLARKKAGFTQRQTAEKIGISHRMYQSIELGEREGKGYIWDKLQDLFGLDQKELRKVTETK